MSTTFAAIRTSLVSAIEALTPAAPSSPKFLVELGEQPFRAWAVANPRACLRRFEIRDLFDHEPPDVSNTDVEYVRHSMGVTVAYPLSLGLYGLKNRNALDDLVRADLHQLDETVGYVGFQDGRDFNCFRTGDSVDEDEAVRFLNITFQVEYYRAV